MEAAMQNSEKHAQSVKRRQHRREVRCACHLRNKLDRWVYGRDAQGWEDMIRLEAVDLVTGQFGPELLVTLGEMYKLRADIYLADELVGRFSMKKRVSSVRHSMVATRHRMFFYQNAASSLLLVKRVHDAAKKIKKDETGEEAAVAPGEEEAAEGGEGSEERPPSAAEEAEELQRKAVGDALDSALPKFLQTAWSAVVTDVDNTVVQVGRKLLKDKSVPWQIRVRRAQAMQLLGEIFVEEGSKAVSEQGITSMSSDAAKATLQEALVESVREKKKKGGARRTEGRPGPSAETAPQEQDEAA